MKNQNKIRKNRFELRLNDEEKFLLEKRVKESGCKSKSRFIRLMVLEGMIVKFNEKEMRKLFRDFALVSSNINQIARTVNSTGSLYADDIAEIKEDVEKLWQQLKSFQLQLRKLKP